jgi:hypothetical protein
MSAIAAINRQHAVPSRRLSELEVIRDISRIASSKNDITSVIESIARFALAVNGVVRVHIEYGNALGASPGSFVWGSRSDDGPIGSAVAELSAGGLIWGELRLHFHSHTSALESPLRFAKFLGQQIGLQLDRWSLQSRAGELKAQIERLQKIVDKRKALHRARAILANTRQISEPEALQFMRQLSESSGRSLHDVAEALIFGDAQKWTQDTRYAARKRGKREFATPQRCAD